MSLTVSLSHDSDEADERRVAGPMLSCGSPSMQTTLSFNGVCVEANVCGSARIITFIFISQWSRMSRA